MQSNTNKQRNIVLLAFLVAAILSLASCSPVKQSGYGVAKQSYSITCTLDTIYNH